MNPTDLWPGTAPANGPAAGPVPARTASATGPVPARAVPADALAVHRRDPAVDPVTVVEAANALRVPELVPIRIGRMISSPFAFLRGSAAVMAADLGASPVSGLVGYICGDAHAANFGLYASPERRLIMDLNDFDEATLGPWEYDLKRLVASVVVAGREARVDEAGCRAAARDCARAYRQAVHELAAMPLLDAYYLTTDHSTLEQFDVAGLVETFDRVRKKARKNTSRRVAQKFTQRPSYDARHFVEDPPVLTRPPADEAARVVASLAGYAGTLDDETRWLFDRYQVLDVAHRIVGLGSVGLRSYVVLLHGNGPDDVLILQVKEARGSCLGASPYQHEGERIVRGQRWMQTVSDVLLGWTTLDGRPFLVRQFRDMKGSIDPVALKPHQLDDYARVVGVVLARAHSQSIDARVLAGGCGADDLDDTAVDAAFEAFAVAYADQTEADHAALVAAVRAGRLAAESGV